MRSLLRFSNRINLNMPLIAGAAVWIVDTADTATTRSVVQVLVEGELWAIETGLLSDAFALGAAKFIPCLAVEKAFQAVLPSYIEFAANALCFNRPLTVALGISNVEGYRLAGPTGAVDASARLLDAIVYDSFVVNEAGQFSFDLVAPFFQKIWKSAGKARPPGLLR
jgi:hypothetical protein